MNYSFFLPSASIFGEARVTNKQEEHKINRTIYDVLLELNNLTNCYPNYLTVKRVFVVRWSLLLPMRASKSPGSHTHCRLASS